MVQGGAGFVQKEWRDKHLGVDFRNEGTFVGRMQKGIELDSSCRGLAGREESGKLKATKWEHIQQQVHMLALMQLLYRF